MKKNKFKIYSALALVLTTTAMIAQPANEFFLESLPQSADLNPAKKHQETFHMNFPAFFMAGQTSMNASLPGFSFSDLATSDGTSTATISLSGLLEGIKDNNYLNMSFQKNFLNYGWIKGKNYWTFGIGTSFNADVSYNKNFMEILVNGPGADDFLTGEPVSLDGTRWDVTVFQEYGVGFSRNVNDKLRLGGKLRLLSGAMNFKGSLDGVSITTAEDLTSLTIASAITTQSASPLLYDEVVTAGDTSSVLNAEETQSNLTSGLTGFSNVGVALDFGGSYQVNDQITAFASVRDFGMIKWGSGKKSTNKANATFSFEGFTVAQLQDSIFFDRFTDSIADILKLEKTEESYTTYLPTRFFIGGEYKFNKQLSANALYAGKLANGMLINTVVAGFGWMPNKAFEARVSYTIQNGSYDNVGLAAVLSLGAWQLYFITNNILGFNGVDYAKNLNASFGSNLTFGRKKYFDELKNGRETIKSGDEGAKSDSSSTNTPDMTPTITPENSVIENVDAMDKAEEEKKAAEKKADEVKSEAKDEVKDSRKASDNKVDDARDDAKKSDGKAGDKVEDARDDAKKDAKKAENKAEADANKAEKRAEKAIDAAEEKIEDADAKVKAANAKAKAAEKEAAAAKKAVAAPAVITPDAAPVAPAATDSISKSATPAVSVDSLLIKPAKKVQNATSTSGSSTTAPKVDATPKDVKTNEGVDALDKTIDEINQSGENKGNDVPSDIK